MPQSSNYFLRELIFLAMLFPQVMVSLNGLNSGFRSSLLKQNFSPKIIQWKDIKTSFLSSVFVTAAAAWRFSASGKGLQMGC